jgi:hypothetical protein
MSEMEIAAVSTRANVNDYYFLRSRITSLFVMWGFRLFMPRVHTYVMRSQHKHSSAFSLLHVRLAVLEQALPDECLAE